MPYARRRSAEAVPQRTWCSPLWRTTQANSILDCSWPNWWPKWSLRPERAQRGLARVAVWARRSLPHSVSSKRSARELISRQRWRWPSLQKWRLQGERKQPELTKFLQPYEQRRQAQQPSCLSSEELAPRLRLQEREWHSLRLQALHTAQAPGLTQDSKWNRSKRLLTLPGPDEQPRAEALASRARRCSFANRSDQRKEANPGKCCPARSLRCRSRRGFSRSPSRGR